MAGLDEMNTFVGKFVKLWQSGRDANLKIECKAGKAFATLQLDLGYPHPPPQPVPSRVVRAGQVRRRQRRAAERQEAAEAVQADHERVVAEEADHGRAVAEEAEHERAVTEEVENEHAAAEQAELQRVEAEQAEPEEVAIENAAVEAKDFTCELCDQHYDSFRALRTHQGKKHKASSPIPQLDGGIEILLLLLL